MSTPRWLDAYATTTGHDPALIGTRAVPRHCRTCHRLVLAGYDAPIAALLATCDPHPLTPRLEAACVILARPTYRLWGIPGRYELTPRHHPGIHPISREPPADQCLVLAAHACGHPPLSHDHLPVTTRHTSSTDGPPPF